MADRLKKQPKSIIARWFGDDEQFGFRFRISLNDFDEFDFECFWSTASIMSATNQGYVHLWNRDIIGSADSAAQLCKIMRAAEGRIRADYKKNGPDRSLGQQMMRIMRGYKVTHIVPKDRRAESPLEVTYVVEYMDQFIADMLPQAQKRYKVSDRPDE